MIRSAKATLDDRQVVPVDAGPTPSPGDNDASYILHELEVFHWGPFSGLHRVEFDPIGTAVIGPTGSGKTTLIDALMTLLVDIPKYNLASTGGHESDRTLISYVRGMLGADGADGRSEVVRPGKTKTGLCATYYSDDGPVKLAALFWIDGTSNAPGDLKRRWVFCRDGGQTLANWLDVLNSSGVRGLTKLGKETTGLRFFDSKKAYLAHTRKFFDVREKAFTLLNRAAGLKQLNSIDEIFRELVLDNNAAFDRALEVAAEFDNLAAIKAELDLARKQRDSLLPVEQCAQKLEKVRKRSETFARIKKILPIWYAIQGHRLWTREAESLEQQRNEATKRYDELRQEEDAAETREKTRYEIFMDVGGNTIGDLEENIETQKSLVAVRAKMSAQYLTTVRRLELGDALDQATFQKNQNGAKHLRSDAKQAFDATESAALDARSAFNSLQNKSEELAKTRAEVTARPGSNIPPEFQWFRGDLAAELGVSDDALPYVAELIEVRPDESVWRGAIERAIGPERLRILVSSHQLQPALRWVNGRDNRLHVRLQEAKADDRPAKEFVDGFVGKLNFKSHPLVAAARKLLVSRDLHCVDSTKELERTEHALTVEGMMSGRKGRFDKQDQKRLSANWLTGFDNKDQLRTLEAELQELAARLTELQQDLEQKDSKRRSAEQQLRLIESLQELSFDEVDLPSAEAALAQSESRLATLLDPASDVAEAKADYDRATRELEAIRKQVRAANRQVGSLDERCLGAEKQRDDAAVRIGPGLSEADQTLAEKALPVTSNVTAEQLQSEERKRLDKIEQQLSHEAGRVFQHEKDLVRLMEAAKRIDTGALVDVDSELDELPHYLDRLRVLIDEALPEKQTRFLDYLNRSSDQGVTQLLQNIEEQVSEIEQRIEDLNETLARVDFRNKNYLQLRPQRIKHESLRSVEAAFRRLRSAKLEDDPGEKEFQSLEKLIELICDAGENPQRQGSRALLDARYRLQFFVVEINRDTGESSAPRTGSQSGSGGEKELMASHILTASRSYALCPTESDRPLYATIVLDEAFSKSSPSAAARIVEALRIFKLHPVFVTPNKEVALLRKHTRRAVCVQRVGQQSSVMSITWDELRDRVAQRTAANETPEQASSQ